MCDAISHILSDREEEQKCKSHEFKKQNLSGEPFNDDKPDTSSSDAFQDCGAMDAYKRAAPQLLGDLAHLLSRHKWSEKDCLPRGIVNILNYSWHDLTSGASLHLKGPTETEKRRTFKGSLKLERTAPQVSASAKKKTGERDRCVLGNVGCSERKSRVKSNPHVTERKQSYNRGKIITPWKLFLLEKKKRGKNRSLQEKFSLI